MQTKINQYDSAETGRYNGKWQIKVGRVGKDEKFYQDFKSVKKKDGTEIKVPVAMTFDTDDDARAFLNMCLTELNEDKPPIQDVPF
jgi:hypothetical protein